MRPGGGGGGGGGGRPGERLAPVIYATASICSLVCEHVRYWVQGIPFPACVRVCIATVWARQCGKASRAQRTQRAVAEVKHVPGEGQHECIAQGAPRPLDPSRPQAGADRRLEELRTALAQEQLMLSKAEGALGALHAAGAAASAQELLGIGGDALAEALDKELGATVTDPAIFRAHAAK